MAQDYTGIVIEESLEDPTVLGDMTIESTKVEPVTPDHKTPWVQQWTLHSVRVPPSEIDRIAEQISAALDRKHPWYADFKTDTDHFIIFRGKVFHITDRGSKAQYDEATRYGLTLGIPEYQLDFSPHIKQWQRV